MRWGEVQSKVRSIEGWILEGQDRWLFETVQCLKDDAVVLEVGPFKGQSTAALAFGCVGTSKQIHSIDTFCGNTTDFLLNREFEQDFLEEFVQNMVERNLDKYVVPHRGKSSQFWNTWTLPIDFLFIDGSHQYEDVKGDLLHFYQHVVPCGVVALHDINHEYPHPGPRLVWRDYAEGLLEGIEFRGTTMGYGFKRCSQ